MMWVHFPLRYFYNIYNIPQLNEQAVGYAPSKFQLEYRIPNLCEVNSVTAIAPQYVKPILSPELI